jgi:hypothetical protein
LDDPLHFILNKSKLAYRIYVILIANKDLKKIVNMEADVSSVTVDQIYQINLSHFLENNLRFEVKFSY